MAGQRKLNPFEKMLMIVGSVLIVLGAFFVYGLIERYGFDWEAMQSALLWLILVILIIIAAVNENMKEELKQVIEIQSQELRLLRDDLRRKK